MRLVCSVNIPVYLVIKPVYSVIEPVYSANKPENVNNPHAAIQKRQSSSILSCSQLVKLKSNNEITFRVGKKPKTIFAGFLLFAFWAFDGFL